MISDTVKHPQMALSVAANYILRQDRDIKRTTVSDWLERRGLENIRSDEHHTDHTSERSKGEL